MVCRGNPMVPVGRDHGSPLQRGRVSAASRFIARGRNSSGAWLVTVYLWVLVGVGARQLATT